MILRVVLAAATAASLLALAPTGALAAKAKVAPTPKVVNSAYDYPVYDGVIDPMNAAIRSELADAGTQGSFLEKRDAAGVAEYYAEQGYMPIWIEDGKLSDRALKVIARIKQAAEDGLDPSWYQLPPAQFGALTMPTAAGIAHADVELSNAVVTFARNLHSGRLDPNAVSPNFSYQPNLLDPLAVLAAASTSTDEGALFTSYNPPHPEFQALRERLAEIRNQPAATPVMVADGPTLKAGMSDWRVVNLRQRLNIADQVSDPLVYDDGVVAAVKAWQASKGLKADGMLGKASLAVLNAVPANPVSTILVNMERWRWMPQDLGPFYVRVNIPNFNLDIYRNDKVIFTTRIVVGQTDKQTPIFSDEIETADVNPTWNVPSSIATKEMLPKAIANPASLAGYQVFENLDGSFRPVDPMQVDWSSVDMRRIQIKQPPGDDNALGSIKFLFPNPYAVYLHDTPSKSFFQRDYRALSHGCMRVQNPWDFAAVLLQDDPNVSVAKLKALVGGRETAVALTHKIPVHITYFTAWIDDSGELQLRNDLYGHDKEMEKDLGLS
ncbi:MAG TPA: L,D-transpeptidase family protein [Bauldia sp.]|nr:L,D-transpeptidase family protein [Bauldia sp.]